MNRRGFLAALSLSPLLAKLGLGREEPPAEHPRMIQDPSGWAEWGQTITWGGGRTYVWTVDFATGQTKSEVIDTPYPGL